MLILHSYASFVQNVSCRSFEYACILLRKAQHHGLWCAMLQVASLQDQLANADSCVTDLKRKLAETGKRCKSVAICPLRMWTCTCCETTSLWCAVRNSAPIMPSCMMALQHEPASSHLMIPFALRSLITRFHVPCKPTAHGKAAMYGRGLLMSVTTLHDMAPGPSVRCRPV